MTFYDSKINHNTDIFIIYKLRIRNLYSYFRMVDQKELVVV